MLAHLHALPDRTALAARSRSGPPRPPAAKAMGFNCIRFFSSVPTRYQLDLCDEIGLMVYEEALPVGWSRLAEDGRAVRPRDHRDDHARPESSERRDVGTAERNIRRPRLPPRGRHVAAGATLDDTRVVMLNSGLFTFVGTATAWRAFDVERRSGPGAERHLQRTKTPIQPWALSGNSGPIGTAPRS